jgi:hypothetical protein
VKPPHAPYTITPDEPIEVRVELRASATDADVEVEEGALIIGEVEYKGDTFGVSVDPLDLGGASLEYAIDEMVAALARYVWHELGGVPTFREEDANLTGRVEVQAPWLREKRVPTLGLIANPEVIGGYDDEGLVPIPTEPLVGLRERSEPVRSRTETEVAMKVTSEVLLSMTPEEAAAVARGGMPESFLLRVIGALPNEDLIFAVRDYLKNADGDVEVVKARDQAERALDEIERRLG